LWRYPQRAPQQPTGQARESRGGRRSACQSQVQQLVVGAIDTDQGALITQQRHGIKALKDGAEAIRPVAEQRRAASARSAARQISSRAAPVPPPASTS